MPQKKKPFIRHFRIYFKNNHPAYIVDGEGKKYVFHRVTHSKTSGGKKSWKKDNPLTSGGKRPMYIVKKEERDSKGRFSLFKLETKPGYDISYPEIKKAGGSQTNHDRVKVVNNITTGKNIKTKRTFKNKSGYCKL